VTDPTARRADLLRAVADLRGRLHAACAAAGRDVSEVTVIAVTKYFPVTDARTLLELGIRDLGENRDQEARLKAAELPEATWHFVGQLQSNKAKSVARYADVVHSVDRPALVDPLAAGAARAQRPPLPVLIQVSLDDAPGRGGIAPAEIDGLATTIAGRSELRLAGLMAVAPLEGDPASAFARLRTASDQLRATHPEATMISAGMSGDLEAAVAHGATHVRIGTALLGPRPPVVG
jgi:pyridoxal phosphate enzyme (YggS family)